jgi:hypothetical protein
MGPRAGLDDMELGTPASRPYFATDSHYTDCATGDKDYVYKTTAKLRGLSPRSNYTDRATATCRRS